MATSAPKINGKTFAQASKGVTDRTALGNLAKQYQNVGSSSTPATTAVPGATYKDGNTRNGVAIPDRVSDGTSSYVYGTPKANAILTKSIASTDLGNKPGDIPTTPVDTTNYSSILAGMTVPGGTTANGNVVTTTDKNGTGSSAVDTALANNANNFQSMLKLLEAPPSMAEAYKQAQKESGILAKQKVVGDLTSQLNGIQAQAQASQLSVVGQGRGIPEAIIGGQQAQIAKEAAIAALPVSAQLQAAQGNLEMAQQNLDTLFKIKSADLTAQYEYKNKLVQSVYDFASTQEKTKLDYALKQEDRAYQEKIAAQEDVKSLASMALKNGAPASVLRNISNAKTYQEALTASAGYGQDPLDRALKQLALNKARSAGSGSDKDPIIKEINGVDYQWDGSKWVTPYGVTGGAGGSASTQALNDKVTSIDNLLKNTQGLKSAVGTNFFARDKYDLTGKKQNFIAGVQQLVSQDTLNTLINLKKQGGTLGALSDTERVMLQSAATKIGQWANTNGKGKVTSYSASEKDFKTELNTIKELTNRAINEASGATDSYLEQIDSALSDMNSPYSMYLQ